MDKAEFLTIFPTFENIEVVKQTLPSVIEETQRNDARLIVHDSSVNGREEKWSYLQELNKNNDFFLLLSDNISMAHVRNMCLFLGQELYAPDFICMLEDDHGVKNGFVSVMLESIKNYYGKVAPNGLRYGMFSGCRKHCYGNLILTEGNNLYPDIDSSVGSIGGVNSCCRCAPTSHWNNVLKGYDTDEYLISTFQTRNVVYRNYHKGFTYCLVGNGELMFDIEFEGRGTSTKCSLNMWDEKYTASDVRSRYLGKNKNDNSGIQLHVGNSLTSRLISKIKGKMS